MLQYRSRKTEENAFRIFLNDTLPRVMTPFYSLTRTVVPVSKYVITVLDVRTNPLSILIGKNWISVIKGSPT